LREVNNMFDKKDDYLEVLDAVVLTAAIEDSITAVRPYFEKAGLKAFVTSGKRDPSDQLRIIRDYSINKKIRGLYPEFSQGLFLNWSLDKKVKFQIDGVDREIFWWQQTWSKLLNIGVLINPPITAECLMDSLRANGTNRKNCVIPASSHFSGKAWDIGGGDDHNPTNEYQVIEEAKKDQNTRIFSLTLERENNCIHINIL
jgi:hypothetical protein